MSSGDLTFRVRGILPDGTAHDLQPVITDDGVTITLTLPNSQRQSPRWQTVTVESSLTQARGGEPGYSCRMSAAGISGASRIAGFGEGTPQQVSREGQNRRIADFGTVVETCSRSRFSLH